MATTTETTETAYRDLLAAIREMLDVSYEGRDLSTRDCLISNRAAYVRGSLRAVLDEEARPQDAARTLRRETYT